MPKEKLLEDIGSQRGLHRFAGKPRGKLLERILVPNRFALAQWEAQWEASWWRECAEEEEEAHLTQNDTRESHRNFPQLQPSLARTTIQVRWHRRLRVPSVIP